MSRTRMRRPPIVAVGLWRHQKGLDLRSRGARTRQRNRNPSGRYEMPMTIFVTLTAALASGAQPSAPTLSTKA